VFIHAYEYYNYGTRRARMRIENVEKLGSRVVLENGCTCTYVDDFNDL
jgi:hypothetical protein